MSTQRIGFSLIGEDIPVDAFHDASQALSGLLSELDVSISGKQSRKWRIADLSTGSANLAIYPNLQDEGSALMISSALSGVALIDKEAEYPPFFTDKALLKAKEFASIINGEVERVAIFGNSGKGKTQRVQVTQRVAAHVDQLIGTSTIISGEIEGTLEALTIHNSTEFSIYEVISSHRVRCTCDRKTLDELTDPARLGRRIAVKGEIRSNVRGEPTSVKVKNYRILRNADELPQAKDIRGLFAKNPINIEEWAKQIRE